jgi:ribosomal protein L1
LSRVALRQGRSERRRWLSGACVGYRDAAAAADRTMSKVSSDTLQEAVQAVVAHAKEHKKKFVETIELQIALKNYDPVKDKRFSGVLRLPVIPRKKFTVCVIGDAKHIEDCKAKGVPFASQDDLKKLKKDKKLVKKFGKNDRDTTRHTAPSTPLLIHASAARLLLLASWLLLRARVRHLACRLAACLR